MIGILLGKVKVVTLLLLLPGVTGAFQTHPYLEKKTTSQRYSHDYNRHYAASKSVSFSNVQRKGKNNNEKKVIVHIVGKRRKINL
jgi:hypothetical protein